MKKRGKIGKKAKPHSKRKDSFSSEDEQISISSSLPPSVEGQIRCFLTVSVSKLTWAVDGHPDDISIRIRWWGEQGQGAVLRPLPKGAAKLSTKTRWTTVRYPVCSGPKQFAAYLNDMGSLNVETVHTSTQIPFGKAIVSGIKQLTASHPVNVVVPVMSVISPFSNLGDIQVFIKFESVSATYNKLSSTIPTVDTGLDKERVDISHPTPPPYLIPATPVTHPKHQRDVKDPFESPAPVKGVKFSEDPPERLEYTIEPYLPLLDNDCRTSQHSNSSSHHLDMVPAINNEATQSKHGFTSGNQHHLPNQGASTRSSHDDRPFLRDDNIDWIGALLERGQKLRDGLAMSTLLDDTNVTEHSPPEKHVLPGRLFQEILSSNKSSTYPLDDFVQQQMKDHHDEQGVGDEDTVVNLLMGDRHDIGLIEHSSYLSDTSEDLSEIGDPLHDNSLLMELFYKSQRDKSAGNDTDITVSTDDDEQQNSPLNVSIKGHDKEIQTSKRGNLETRKLSRRDTSSEEEEDSLDTQQITEVPEELSPRDSNDILKKLGADTLTTLGRVNTARVIIQRLQLIDTKALEKQASSEKPSTYFVEYHFPITTKDTTTGSVSMVKELTRVASKKLHNEAVMFNHRSVFPVSFNASVLDQWWGLGLTFRVLKRRPGQRMPEEFGVGVLPLKTVLLSNTLSHASLIEVTGDYGKSDHASSSSEEERFHGSMTGKLEVKIELGLDGKQLHCQASSTTDTTDAATGLQQDQRNVVVLPKLVVTSVTNHVALSNTHNVMDVVTSKPPLPNQLQHQARGSRELEDPPDTLTLHSLLWIPEAKGITLEASSSGRTGNLFLVSRMFWCDEVSKSPVLWGTNNPQFGYKQVAPVLLTPTLLHRTCNNFMVIEVWDKVIPQGEKLVGIIKLPLHQLYLSFRDPKITKTLIKSKFPVICIDGLVPIINPFTTCNHGELKVLLAMGTQEQIAGLLEIKGAGQVPTGLHNKDSHHLDKQREPSQSNVKHSIARNSSNVDHQFEITVEDIRGLSIFKSTVWGETDCYVQYHFPSQVQSIEDLDNEVVPGLKSCHTCTTLCVPDPSFQDTTRHSFVLSSGVPVQRYLLAAYSGSWTSMSSIPGSSGIPFELWRRYYYPNVRDQLVAKANLPVAKLCAMVTMKRHREPSVQTFSLPLAVLPEGDRGTKQTMIEDSGLLDVSIRYRANKVQTREDEAKLGGDHVCLSLDVIRICGLKDAAKLHAQTNPSMLYPADVGVNVYVIIKLPIGKKRRHITRTVARTFAPEFSHHVELATPLRMCRKSSDVDEHHQGEIISLAERLEMSEAVFEVWHQDAKGFSDDHHQTKPNKYDVLLGVVRIPLTDLLNHRTGIRGWHTIKTEEKLYIENTVLGGLQMSIKFEGSEDRENVIHEGRRLGWSPPPGVECVDDKDFQLLGSEDEDSDSDGQTTKGITLTVKMRRACIPRSLLEELKGHPDLSNLEAKGYVRYKLYDKSPICSSVVHVRQNEEDIFLLDFKHSKCFLIPTTSSLFWYLREEKLEAQVWLRGQAKPSHTLPEQRDKLVGSAFITLSTMTGKGVCQSQTSGTFPLFKVGAYTLDGACVQVQITLAKPTSRSHSYIEMEDHNPLDHSISSDDYPSTKGHNDNESESLKSSSDPKTVGKGQRHHVTETQSSMDDSDSFSVHIIVQEACHLNSVAGHDLQRVHPNAYVTYQISSSSLEVSTPVCQSSSSPLWQYQKLERLPLSMLKTQNLIFKVWHKTPNSGEDYSESQKRGHIPTSGDDVPLGFASVDLRPLTVGLRQLIGWYNIMDFTGECKGQIKVGVVPLTPVSPSCCLPKSRIDTRSSLSIISKAMPFQLLDQEQQEKVPVAHFLPDQKTHLESFQRPGSIDISLPEENTKPVTPSSTLLFKQLRENMKDLDNLQRRLQAKLQTDSSPHGLSGAQQPTEGTPHIITMEHHTQEISADRCESSSSFTRTELVGGGHLPQDRNPRLGVSEPDNVFGKNGEKSYCIPKVNYKDIKEKTATHNDKLIEKTSHISETVTKHTDLPSEESSGHPAMEAATGAQNNTVIEGTLMERVQYHNLSPDNEISCSSASDLEECSDSDSVENHGEDIEGPSVLMFTEEKDSWLSSTEEDETNKAPLNSTAYSLINRGEQDEDIPNIRGQSDSPSNKHSEDENWAHENKHQGIKETIAFDKDPLNGLSYKDNGNCEQNHSVGENNELLQTNCDQTSVSNSGNQSQNAQIDTKLSYLPNFFMPREQLETSMRALRLGTRLSHSYAPSFLNNQSKLLQRACNEGNSGTREIASQYSQKQAIYKAKKDGQLPLSSSEIERIARIFSSNDS